MNTITFRGNVGHEADNTFNLRELIRGRKHRDMPAGSEGFVAEDLDLILRWFGPNTNYPDLTSDGRIRLIEIKRVGRYLSESKYRTFGLLDRELGQSEHYDGLYLVHHSDGAHDDMTSYWVNEVPMSCDEFLEWALTPYSPIPRLFT